VKARAIVAAYAGFWNPEGTLLRGGFYCDVSCVVEQEEEEEGEEAGEETKENEQEEAKEEEAKEEEAKKQEGRPNLELAPTPSHEQGFASSVARLPIRLRPLARAHIRSALCSAQPALAQPAPCTPSP
jgi:ABC-type Zn2+ transport system substrate-binding protein/surface adhesin